MLSGWELHVYDIVPGFGEPPPVYDVSPDGTVATQTANALPSVYYHPQSLQNVRIRGRFTVETTVDDDLVGFVFGWQDPEHYYVVDWAQATQTFTGCGTASAGVRLRRVNATTETTGCDDFWADTGTAASTILSPASANPTGWSDNTAYDFVLEWVPGDIWVAIYDGSTVIASISSSDALYSGGSFGFFSYSQQAVRYELVRLEPL
jgi:hypothetical protein